MRIIIIFLVLFISIGTLKADEIFNLIKIPNLQVYDLKEKNKLKYLIAKKDFELGSKKNIKCNKITSEYLKKTSHIIKKNLNLYNQSFLKKNNIRFIVLCENLSISDINTAGIPDINKRTLILDISFNDKYFERVIHHEIFHMIQNSNKSVFNEDVWSSFNNKEFEYSKCSTCSNKLGLDLLNDYSGFLTEYSQSIPSEDMAEVFSFLMIDRKKLMNISKVDNIIDKKVKFLIKNINKIDNTFFE